jgi:hypothetical protein
VKACDNNIKQTLLLVNLMIQLANQGEADREDTGCGILYGILRDSAYKLSVWRKKKKLNTSPKGGGKAAI